jgi:uncharacterized membrane protein YphA (DoxX/SURF4 family)
MGWLNMLNATFVAKLQPLLCSAAMHWIALLCLCSAYLQGGLTKAFNFGAAIDEMKQFGLKPPVPLALAIIVLEIGASVLVLSGFCRWAGALMLGVFTLFVVGGFILVAWYDLQG